MARSRAAAASFSRFTSLTGFRLSREAESRLQAFAELVKERAVPLGLVADSDVGRIHDRHVLDCLRAVAAFRPEDRVAYDIGSGAGLPGIVLACALPDRRFLLVDPKRKAAGFLELAVDRLGLRNVEVLLRRVDQLGEPADLATARAFAPLPRAWHVACSVLRPGGRLVYFAGQGLEDPEAVARSLVEPEPPGEVEVLRWVETVPPLVIMSRSMSPRG